MDYEEKYTFYSGLINFIADVLEAIVFVATEIPAWILGVLFVIIVITLVRQRNP